MLDLIRDTLLYLRSENLIGDVKPLKVLPVTNTPKVKPIPPLKKQEETSSEYKPKLQEKPPALASGSTIYDRIQKHIPHLHLINEIPSPQTALILFEDDRELPFLKNLARAIQTHLAPVKICRWKKENIEENPLLVLTPTFHSQFPKELQIQLLSAEHYQKHAEQKKLLWNQICQRLSPKLS